jgi:hypothetical protein
MGTESASGKVVEGTEAASEFRAGQVALAIQAAQEIGGGPPSFLRIALQTAGDKVAVGIAAELHLRNDVVDALHTGTQAAHAVEAAATFSGVNGLAKRMILHEVDILEVEGIRPLRGGVKARLERICTRNGARNFAGKKHMDNVAGLAALDQAQSAACDETADGGASATCREAHAAGEPAHGEGQAALAFEAAVTQEVQVDGLVDGVESEVRNDKVFELFPHEYGIEFLVFHDVIQVSRRYRRGRRADRPWEVTTEEDWSDGDRGPKRKKARSAVALLPGKKHSRFYRNVKTFLG